MIHRILDLGHKAGLYSCPTEQWPALLKAAEARKFQLLETTLGNTNTLEDLLCRLADDLGFPDWFGNNLDALHDLLTDPEWHHGHTQIIRLGSTTGSCSLPEESWECLFDVLQSAIDIRREENAPLWVITNFNTPQIPLLPRS